MHVFDNYSKKTVPYRTVPYGVMFYDNFFFQTECRTYFTDTVAFKKKRKYESTDGIKIGKFVFGFIGTIFYLLACLNRVL